jgi:hypothetical protein
VAYLRFTPDEYRAIANLCRPFDLRNTRPRLVKQMLVASLADPLPPLADRIARLDHNQFHLLLIRVVAQYCGAVSPLAWEVVSHAA